jgi:hypothetical protein
MAHSIIIKTFGAYPPPSAAVVAPDPPLRVLDHRPPVEGIDSRHERLAGSAEDSQHALERQAAPRMIQGITLRCVLTVIKDLQDGQDDSVLTDPAVVNLSGQPLTDRFTARPARGDLTADRGKSGYGLRT